MGSKREPVIVIILPAANYITISDRYCSIDIGHYALIDGLVPRTMYVSSAQAGSDDAVSPRYATGSGPDPSALVTG